MAHGGSSFPKALDTIYGGAETFAKYVSEATDGKFGIQTFSGGGVVSRPAGARQGAGRHRRDGPHRFYYYWGKDPTFGFGHLGSVRSELRAEQAWWTHGGGKEVLNEFFAGYNAHALLAGNTGAQMGGWFRARSKASPT